MIAPENSAVTIPSLTLILASVKQGDRKSFDALQQQLLPSVERFVRRLIGQAEDRNDIVREAFLALWISRNRITNAEGLLPFLYRVARNTAYDILRSQGRFDIASEHTKDDSEGELVRFPSDAIGPEEETLRLQLWAEVQVAIDRLPEMQRQTLILYAEEDFTYQQIADTMSCDIGTVRTRLHHARRNTVRHLRPDTREALGLTNTIN